MSYTDKKITQEEINAHHVQGATDHLIGNAQQNKAVFDDLPEFIAGKHNELIDELNSHHGDEIKVAVYEWLAEHPEVTTTVQDNSLTTAKYVDGSVTEPKIAEGAVTPSKLDRAYSTPADLASVNANLTNELNVLDARMDEFASLPEGSTSGNAELVDIRVGANGIAYPSSGDAVRGQVADLKSDLSDETSARILLAGRVTTAESNIDTLETHKVAQPLDEYNQPTDGTDGQSLRTKGDGTTEWADIGLPTDEQTAQAVSDWLDEHPEATTTVEDGSLTEPKFSEALKIKTIKDYITPQMFGAKADGITDDTLAIQACFDAVEDGGTIYFPKVGGDSYQPHYKITDTLVLSKNDVTITSESSSEYQEGLYSENDITMMKVTGFGCSISNLAFMGNGEVYKRSGTTGLLFDRRGLGDEETYSNIDCKITNCNFAFLDDCVHVCGKNALISDNLFSNSIRGVVVSQHTYESGGTTIGSELRGIRVFDNRFHSIGQYYFPTRTEMGQGNYPTDLTEVDSWCVELPTDIVSNQIFNGIEIINNSADVCFGGFYKGTLVGVRIANNAYVYGSALFCYCPSSNTALTLSSQTQSVIQGNIVYGYPQTTRPDRGYSVMFANIMVISGINNLRVTDNSLKICGETSIELSECTRMVLSGNFINNANRFFTEDSTKRNVVIITNCTKAVISDNFIDSQYGIASVYGFEITGGSNIGYINNYVFGGVDYETNESSLIPLYQKPFTAGDWILPTLQNNFELNSPHYGFGYRKTMDGYVDIYLSIKNGLDNNVAFNLPNGYRPSKPLFFMTSSGVGHTVQVLVDNGGNVTINDLQVATGESLSGASGFWLCFRFPIQ